jgi:hypothetical protein
MEPFIPSIQVPGSWWKIKRPVNQLIERPLVLIGKCLYGKLKSIVLTYVQVSHESFRANKQTPSEIKD